MNRFTRRPFTIVAASAVAGGSVLVLPSGPAGAQAPNQYEQAVCASYGVLTCGLANSSATAARQDTVNRFGFPPDGTRVNAFQHSSWNARMSVVIGSRGVADDFATAHERPINSGNPPGPNVSNRHERMDLCNNYRGRAIVGNWDILTGDQLTPVGKLERAARSLSTNRSSHHVLLANRSCNGSGLRLIAKNNGVVIT